MPSIDANENAHVVLQFYWDSVEHILQDDSRLSKVRWSSLKDMEDEDVHSKFSEADGDMLTVMRQDELRNI